MRNCRSAGALTGIPVASNAEGERENCCVWNKRVGYWKAVIGQNEAVEAVSNAIRRSRAGRPIRTVRLVPSVPWADRGRKTRTVKRWLTLCSTATTRWCAYRCSSLWRNTRFSFVGAPGYVGYEEGGYRRKRCRRPYSVILLDEVEKAHPDVFNILLQVLTTVG